MMAVNNVDLSTLDDKAEDCEREEGQPQPAALPDDDEDEVSLDSVSESDTEGEAIDNSTVVVNVSEGSLTRDGKKIGGVQSTLNHPETAKMQHWQTLWLHKSSDLCKEALEERAQCHNDNIASLPGLFSALPAEFSLPQRCSALDGVAHHTLNNAFNQLHKEFIVENKKRTHYRKTIKK